MDAIARVRRFNRTVTERIGALDDHYLAHGRPLGQSRLLWEIGADGAELRMLRSRLDIDSGYLSRQLRALEAEGLVTTGAHTDDTRVRIARLTSAGETERAEIDRLSDELVAGMLAALSERQRERLVAAMDEVRQLIDASAIVLAVTDPREASARTAIGAYYDELAERFEQGFDPAVTRPTTDDDFSVPRGLLLVATLHDEPVGCVGLKLHGDDPAEIKRLWVSRSVRGLGLGRRLLSAVEDEARHHGAAAVRLDTNRTLTEAIALYRSSGYTEIPAFNDEPYAHHWFEKQVGEIA